MLYAGAKQLILPENASQSRITPTTVILHSAVDAPGETSLYPYFARSDVGLESHFFIQLDGDIEQYMDTNVRADANRYANGYAISIETEDDGNPNQRPWTVAQIDSIIRLGLWIQKVHGIPPRICRWPQDAGWGYHAMWGSPSVWTPVRGKTCPGTIRVKQFPEVVMRLQSAGKQIHPPTERDPMGKNTVIIRRKSDGAGLLLNDGFRWRLRNLEDVAFWKFLGVPIEDCDDAAFEKFAYYSADGDKAH